jgi:peptidoglycan/LPS O-acetylase OafA/YrhL
MKPEERIPELDGVRAVAVTLVVAHHSFWGIKAEGLLDSLILAVASAGWIGVDLFFLLSGYLITGILIAGRGSPGFLRSFYARRTLRIFPGYYALLFLVFVAGPAAGVSLAERNLEDAVWFWSYLSNVFIAFHPGISPVLIHLWSLSVEEHFYLLWPIFVLATPARLLPAGAFLIALGSAWLRYLALSRGFGPHAVYFLTPTRLDALAIGALLELLATRGGSFPMKLGRLGGSVSVVALAFGAVALITDRGNWSTWRHSQLVAGIFASAVALAGSFVFLMTRRENHPLRALLRTRLLTAVGARSYAIYLYHMPLMAVGIRLGLDPLTQAKPGIPNWPYLAVYSLVYGGLLLMVAELSWRFVETPFLRLKDRFPYRSSGGVGIRGTPGLEGQSRGNG